MSAAKWKKLRGLLERAQHPGTPGPEVATCLKTALRIVVNLERRALEGPPTNGRAQQDADAGGPRRVVRWEETCAGCVTYADDKKITIAPRYIHGKRFFVLDFDGERIGDMFATMETAQVEAEARLWVPDSL